MKRWAITFILCFALYLAAGCRPASLPSPAPSILLFNGTGTSPNDVSAVERILKKRNLDYATADSDQLNNLSEAELKNFRLLIIPGGNYLKMGAALTSTTTTNIHRAVQNGLNYLGICAGGLLAGSAPCNNLNLSSGVRFGFYAVVNKGIHKTPVTITTPGNSPLQHYWEDGPEFTGWGSVVGKYPDGTPAIVQSNYGNGWVILCGVHPEAPESWRRDMDFSTPAGDDHAFAALLIEAALNRKELPHF